MKGTISFAEIRAIASFLSRYRGGYVEKNYRREDEFSFKFRKGGINSIYLHFMHGNFIFLDEENRVEGKKNSLPIENSLISDVRQLGTDRILLVEGPKSMIIEMMGGGNLFILDGNTIEFCRKEIRRKGRILKKGEYYEPPDYIDVTSDSFDAEAEIRSSSADPVRTLAVKLGLSKYAEEILCALGKEVGSNDILISSLQEIRKLIEKLLSSASEGRIFLYGDEFYVWRSFCRKEEPEELDLVKGLARMYFESDQGKSKAEAVERSVERMREEMVRMRKVGEYIMEHLPEIDLLLSNVKGLNEKYRVDFERGTITLKEGGMDIVLKIGKTAGENAAEYFEGSKRIRDRLSRVKVQEEKRTKERKEIRRVFSNYRWFINSDGNLVLAGKDAETNDSVVKKYLGDKDIYFHADIHGAPSVVMKVVFPVTDRGIEETAEFAWCMSKAWSSKLGNGSVFYVTRSQVSKTPESGEYLARGAWVIRGKKNYVSHLQLELAVGFQKYENREYVVCAPPSSIKGRKVVIIPGEGKERETSEIAEFLEVEREAVFSVLPPGGIAIREKLREG